ncbi:NAD-dependent epimerase [Tenuifilaceae bacterium CYCD]|nr:NAD-dependent epimerase [Tenuifilaceae bacterium CYCD]
MILVTGGTGLVGSHLLYELARKGESIRAIKRANSNTNFVRWVFELYNSSVDSLFQQIEWVDADLLDYESLIAATKNIETVYHTGAVVSFNPSQAKTINTTNVIGTANLVDACLESGVKNFCHVSSVAALGDSKNGAIDESCKWEKSKGQSAYAKSKFMGENEVWRGFEQGLRVIIVNPSVILGPGRWDSGSGQLFKQVRKGMPFYTTGITGYVDVRDVARAMILLLDNPNINGERFVLNAQNLSYNEVFSMMADGLGKKPPRLKVDPWIVNAIYPFIFFAGIISGKGNAISKANLKSAFSKTFYSSEKITSKIGFNFTPISKTIEFVSSIYLKDLEHK